MNIKQTLETLRAAALRATKTRTSGACGLRMDDLPHHRRKPRNALRETSHPWRRMDYRQQCPYIYAENGLKKRKEKNKMKSRYYENLPTGQLIPETDRKARYMDAFAKAFERYDLLVDALYSEEEHGTAESYAEILRQKDKAESETVRLYNGLVLRRFRPGPHVHTNSDLWKDEIVISVQNRLAE